MLRRSTVCNGHGEPRSALRQESELVGRRGLEPRTSAVGPAERCTNEIESLGAGCPSYAVRPRPILSPSRESRPVTSCVIRDDVHRPRAVAVIDERRDETRGLHTVEVREPLHWAQGRYICRWIAEIRTGNEAVGVASDQACFAVLDSLVDDVRA